MIGADGSDFEDEGESLGSPMPPTSEQAQGTLSAPPITLPQRVRQAWLFLRGREVSKVLTSDPAGDQKNVRARDENTWRNIYAAVLLFAMLWQVKFANDFMLQYAESKDFEIPAEVIIAFLSAAVVEVIGLVLVITRSIFPNSRDTASTAS